MAVLSVKQIQDLIKKPAHKDKLQEAISHENRLNFHCEPTLELGQLSPYYHDYIRWVSSFLPQDKVDRFKALLTAPVETVDFTESIFTEYVKVFEAQNKYIKVDFVSDEVHKDYADYFQKLGDTEFWPNKGFDALRNSINSFIVVDLPTEQKGSRPEPYYYLLDVRSVHDVEVNKDGNVEYIMFMQSDGSMCIFDDSAFYKFKKLEGQEEWVSFFDQKHNLGYAPVKPFYQSAIKSSNNINKKSPITNALSKLDWLLFWAISKKYLDLYGAYPIVVSYKETCSYKNEQGYECNEGYVDFCVNEADVQLKEAYPELVQRRCPVCEARKGLGPGTELLVDAPVDKDDVDLVENAIKFVEMSNQKLDYGVSEIKRLRNEIFLDCVGYDGDARHDIAKNETQVYSGFESKRNILMDIKRNFEVAHKFAIDTICRLRYGNYFVRSTVDYGTVFYLQSVENLIAQYEKGKSTGLPSYELNNILEQINRTANRNNPDQLHRNLILQHLEPYPEYTLKELKDMGFDVVDRDNFLLKANFNTYIRRFEREVMNIIEFGSLTSFEKKINNIKQKLLNYVNEQNFKASPQPNSGGNGRVTPEANAGAN